MSDLASKRQAKLQKLAEEDEIYQVWAKSYRDCKEAFAQFAACQPEDIRNMLYGYAECGRLMQQRLVNLACKNMICPEEK